MRTTVVVLWYLYLCTALVVDALSVLKNVPSVKIMVDLRSDTLTKPTPAMRKMMYEAEVGDDVFQEDPTVNKLEKRIASMFSKEASLFLPTGTMSNLVAAMAWCGQRGAEAILGDCSHMYLYEQGNLAHIAGVSPRALPNRADGTVSLEGIEAAIRASNIHFPQTSLISLENTHNYCGGRVLPDGYIDTVSTLAGKRGIPLHLDGARIWNAATATASTVAELTASVDSVTACLSKGLGAPSGSMLVGPRDFIDRARRHRKALGGGMRQVGVLAAAGLQALDDFEAGVLGTDHRRARHIAEGLSGIPGVEVDPAVVDSNIVLVHLKQEVEGPAVFAAALREEHEVLVMPFGPRTLRLVTHRDLVEEDVTTVVWAFKDVAARMTSTPHAALVLPLSADKLATAMRAAEETQSREVSDNAAAGASGGDTQDKGFEAVSVRGMSGSAEGFCVILQGATSDRCVRVLVTPEDPMSDGLDHDEVESSEAVTLLQLLQGIDVETHLAKDAFAAKFGGDDAQKYELRMVRLGGIGRGKDFEASLVGSVRRRNEAGAESPPGSVKDCAENQHHALPPADDVNEDKFLLPETIPQHRNATQDNHAASASNPDGEKVDAGVVSASQRTTSDSRASSDRTVSTDSAFYAIALALRHHVAIEVRSDLMLDEKKSFPSSELASLYPKLLAATPMREAEAQSLKAHAASIPQPQLTEIAQGSDAVAKQGHRRSHTTPKPPAKQASKQEVVQRESRVSEPTPQQAL